MKKQLNTDAIKNELEGSVFFPRTTKEPAPPPEQVPASTPLVSEPHQTEVLETSVVSRYRDTVIDTVIPSNHDTTIPVSEEGMIEAVRKAVKQTGKEPATQRLTLEEKQALRSIEFTYAQQGIMTSGNEMIRIGMNFILKDYQKNGENSILANVLKRLNF